MATVLMFGRPPPAKPYRHPASASVSALAATAPDRGIERRRRVHRHDRKLKTSATLREIDTGADRHAATIQLSRAAGQRLPRLQPLGLKHAAAAVRHHVVQRVRALDEAPH